MLQKNKLNFLEDIKEDVIRITHRFDPDRLQELIEDGYSLYPKDKKIGILAEFVDELTPSIIDLLIKLDCDPNQPGIDGKTPLDRAVNSMELRAQLIKHGAKVKRFSSKVLNLLSRKK